MNNFNKDSYLTKVFGTFFENFLSIENLHFCFNRFFFIFYKNFLLYNFLL